MEIKSNTKFCHFTSIDNARNILSSESFFLSKYSKMNDLAESKIHEKQDRRAFVLCFSNSEALNIPAFYLYGGIDGKGCRIQFTDARIRSLINDSDIYYVNKQNKPLKKAVSKSEYRIYYDWIYYISRDGYCEHKSERKQFGSSIDTALQELEKDNKHFFVKSPIWRYENEFRIVVVFEKDIPYDRISIKFAMNNKNSGVSIMCGPETKPEEYEQLKAEFRDYGVNKFKSSSDYAISMNLVDRNRQLLKGIV